MISPEDAAKDKSWWRDERYAIFDLSTNSAIAHPAHNEQLSISGSGANYTIRGYAYSGGGRRVTRVELSINMGKTWRLAKIDYPEDRYKEAGVRDLCGDILDMEDRETSLCWCFWNLDIIVSQLIGASDILVRAMDESMNLQPGDMYWSVLGMMHNPWFRVAIVREQGYIRFEHPTQPALMPGGWMEKVKTAGGNLTNGYWGAKLGHRDGGSSVEETAPQIKMTNDDVKRIVEVDEVRRHGTAEDPWFVVNGDVYDGTAFLQEHPGGPQSIVSAAGMDCTEEFIAIHNETAKAMMKDYHIGSLDDDGKAAFAETAVQPDAGTEALPTFLQPRMWKKAVLHSKATVSWDTRLFTFKLDHEEQTLGLPIGQHLLVRLRDPVTGETIIRSYTPISGTSKKGLMDLLVKVYFNRKDRQGGKMSQAMNKLAVNDSVEFKGPIGRF